LEALEAAGVINDRPPDRVPTLPRDQTDRDTTKFWTAAGAGAPWRDLPERRGPWRAIHDRFVRCWRDDTFDRIHVWLRLRLDPG
jgi:transposase